MNRFSSLFFFGIFLLMTVPVSAQTNPAPAKSRTTTSVAPSGKKVPRVTKPVRRSRYSVYLVTMDPGDVLYASFGHNAIRVVDYQLGTDLLYNFGTFALPRKVSFGAVSKFAMDYLNFRLNYWVSRQRASYAVRLYRYLNRTYRERKLLLTEREKEVLVGWLRTHHLRKNRYYHYHHYQRNCSTKVRDALKATLGADFRRLANVRTKSSFRKEVMVMMRTNPALMVAMDFGMGPYADKPITRWQQFFLPHHLEKYTTLPVWQKKRGRPLVAKAIVRYQRKGAAPPTWKPHWFVYGLLGLWLLIAALLWKRDWFRIWFRLFLIPLSLMGLVLGFMMFFTGMPEPPKNANLLLYHPFHLLAWWFVSRLRWQTPRVFAFLEWYVLGHLLVGGLYLLAKLVGITPVQTNLHYFLLVLIPFAMWTLWSRNKAPEQETEAVPAQPIPTR